MKIKKNNNTLSDNQSASKSCRADETFRETLERIIDRIDIECFTSDERPVVRELYLIMAEVYRLPPSERVKIDGRLMPAADVAAVFDMLNCEHIRFVLEKNADRTYRVKYRKAYLRTLLYNSAFELESRTLEDF